MFVVIRRPQLATRTGKFPKLPKLDRYKIAALICGFLVWFGYGFVLRIQYQPLIAILIGLAVAYGPLALFIALYEWVAWLMFKRSKVHIAMLVVFATRLISTVTVFLEGNYINHQLINIGYTGITFLLPSGLLFGITWIVMPYLWFRKTDDGSFTEA